MEIAGTLVEETFAEAFGMRYVRLIVTAHDEHWLDAAQRAVAGYGSSIIACDAEIGLEQTLSAGVTPDGRPGIALLAFGFSADALAKAIANRTGQCLMTCPTTAVYDGLEGGTEQIPLGKHLRFFGDGYQKSKLIGGRRYWRIPVMDGEFVVADRLTVRKGVAGGNIILQSDTAAGALDAARRASGAGPLARRHHAISRRRRPQWQQSRFALQSPQGVDRRRLLPDPTGPGCHAASRWGQLCLRDRDRWLR